MELSCTEVLKVLREKGVDALHHANTVQTACLFLRSGQLLSRGTAEARGLRQTPQNSDAIDRRFGIWFDVFLDAVDIHGRAGSRNLYGPVVFRFDLDLLSGDQLSSVWVTKKNPTRWIEGEATGDRYFASIEEFGRDYRKGDFNSMFMLRNCGGSLALKPHLQGILVDDFTSADPDLDGYSRVVGALRASAWHGDVGGIAVTRRQCAQGCACSKEYGAMQDAAAAEFTRLFDLS